MLTIAFEDLVDNERHLAGQKLREQADLLKTKQREAL